MWPRHAAIALPERHLGLVQAEELARLDQLIAEAARLVAERVDLDAVLRLAECAWTAPMTNAAPRVTPPGQRSALARDAAFSFIYPHVLEGWRASGAEIVPFSPLGDEGPDRFKVVLGLLAPAVPVLDPTDLIDVVGDQHRGGVQSTDPVEEGSDPRVGGKPVGVQAVGRGQHEQTGAGEIARHALMRGDGLGRDRAHGDDGDIGTGFGRGVPVAARHDVGLLRGRERAQGLRQAACREAQIDRAALVLLHIVQPMPHQHRELVPRPCTACPRTTTGRSLPTNWSSS